MATDVVTTSSFDVISLEPATSCQSTGTYSHIYAKKQKQLLILADIMLQPKLYYLQYWDVELMSYKDQLNIKGPSRNVQIRKQKLGSSVGK